MAINLKGNSNSTYSDDVTITDSLYAGTIQGNGGANSNGINFRGISAGQETFRVDTDGSAEFAGGKFTISDKGNISRVGTGGNYYNLGAFNNSGTTTGATGGRLNLFTDDPDGTPDVQTIALNGLDGSAEFAGDIQSTSQNGGPLAGFRNLLILSLIHI